MRTDRRLALAIACAAALGGCATAPAGPARSPADNACAAGARRDLCDLPADVRAFVEDRDLCDHFRGEPWPEGDAEADRARRRQLVDGVRTNCAGTDHRLAELKSRHAGDARITALLGRYEPTIGN